MKIQRENSARRAAGKFSANMQCDHRVRKFSVNVRNLRRRRQRRCLPTPRCALRPRSNRILNIRWRETFPKQALSILRRKRPLSPFCVSFSSFFCLFSFFCFLPFSPFFLLFSSSSFSVFLSCLLSLSAELGAREKTPSRRDPRDPSLSRSSRFGKRARIVDVWLVRRTSDRRTYVSLGQREWRIPK